MSANCFRSAKTALCLQNLSTPGVLYLVDTNGEFVEYDYKKGKLCALSQSGSWHSAGRRGANSGLL